MMVNYLGEEFNIPDVLIDTFVKQFDCLPGSGDHQSVMMLRNSIEEVLDIIADDPEVLAEPDYMSDFVRALAVRQALSQHGILYDA
jgi:hypothetical protein